MSWARSTLTGLLVAHAACGGAPAAEPARCEAGGLRAAGVTAKRSSITVGSTRSILGLSDAEQNAVVRIEVRDQVSVAVALCSGVLVARRWVLTARHCVDGMAASSLVVTFGDGGGEPLFETRAVRFETHDTLDVAAVELQAPPPSTLARAISVKTDAPDPEDGRVFEVAGFGATAELEIGARLFAAVNLLALESELYVSSAAPLSGACIGDSGGPLLARDDDGKPAVLGVLSFGSGSCRGSDRYVRLDRVEDFLANLPEADSGEETPCGDVLPQGACFSSRSATWCEAGRLSAQRCDGNLACGWSDAARGFRCVPPDTDPCQSVSGFGACDGDVALRCVDGTLRRVECGVCGLSCLHSPRTGEAACFELSTTDTVEQE